MYERRPWRCSWPVLVTIGLVTVSAFDARADEPRAMGDAPAPPDRRALYKSLDAPPSGYARILAGLGFGGGFRFNNPYRLATQLGQTAASVSATAPFTTLSAALAFGRPDGLGHGGYLGLSFALSGVSQAVLAPGYILVYRGPGRLLGYGRAAPAFVLSPDTNVGAEVACGAAFFLTGGLGLALDVAGNLFYGASTWEKKYPVYPVLSASLGVLVDVELLP
jgi:hypothetical protein